MYDQAQPTRAACGAPKILGLNLGEVLLAAQENREPRPVECMPTCVPRIMQSLINCVHCKRLVAEV